MRNAQEACKIDVSESAARLHGRAALALAHEEKRAQPMAITGKQVRQLRSMANNLKPTVIVGKEGVTANILKQVN